MSDGSPITGIIIKGDGRGRALGFPTANLQLTQPTSFSPGVYAGWAHLNDDTTWYRGAIHIGPRPTFLGASATVEVHLLDFHDRDLYGQTLTCTNVTYLRPVKKFESVEALVAAIQADCDEVRRILKQPLG